MNRYLGLFFVALVVFLGALVGALALTSQRDEQLRGYVNPLGTSELPYRVPLLGVNAELMQYEPDELTDVFTQMESAGVHWVRQFVDWRAIQPQPDQFEWDAWDAIIERITQTELELIVVFMNTPGWAGPDYVTNSAPEASTPPAEPEQFAAFTSAFAARYSDTIDYYQIWDEPNLITAWGGLEPKPAAYLALLAGSYQAIHAADAGATVLTAALAPTTEDNLKNISDLTYLDTLYQMGLAEHSDGIAAKPYGFDAPPDDRTVRADTLNYSRIIALREIMDKHGDSRTALWASNWGWNTLPDTWQGSPSIWGKVSQDQQITYTAQALDRAWREWPWIGGMTLYHWQPDAAPEDPVWGFALVGQDNRPTPLLEHLINTETQTTAGNGHYPPRTPFASYTGLWTFSDLGADIGWQRDSRLTFSFEGSSVGFILQKGDYVGYLYPQIDGQFANSLPQDSSGNSYLILTSGSLEPERVVVPVADDLPDEQHTLSAVADRGFDQYALRGYAVSSGDLAKPFNRSIAVAFVAALIAGVIAVGSALHVHWSPFLKPLSPVLGRLNTTWQLIISVITSIALMLGMLLTFGDVLPNLFRREPVHLVFSLLTAGLLYLNPGLILTIVSGMVLFVLIYNNIAIGLMLILLYAPFFLFPVELFSFAFPMAELLTLLTFGAFILKMLSEWARLRQIGAHRYPLFSFQLHPLDYAVIGWVALGCLSLLWANRFGLAVTELRVMIIEPALFYLVFRAIKPDDRNTLRIIDALLVAGTLVAVIGLYLFAQGQSVITAEGEARRLASVYGSPNNVALLLGRCIPFALVFFLRFKGIRRWAACIAGVLMLIAVLLTQSVGGIFIGIPAGIALVLLLTYGKRAVIPLAGILVISVIAFALLASQSERFARALDFTQGTNFYRIRVWESALEMIEDYPITGVGLDQFLYEFRGHYIRPDAWQEPDLSHPHNIVLDFWTRLGLFGVVLLCFIQWHFWTTLKKRWSAISLNPITGVLVVGAAGSMANLIAHGMIDNSVYVNDLALVFVLLLGIATNIYPEKSQAIINS